MKRLFKFILLKNHNKKAFSLVEVLCAIVLLAIVATPILQAIYSGLSLNIKSRKLLAASDVCSGTMEFVSSLVFDDYKNLGKDSSGVSVDVMGLYSYYWGKDSGDISKCYFSNKGINPDDGSVCGILYPHGPICDYSNIIKTDDKHRTLNLQNVDMDGFKFDVKMNITNELPSTGDADNDYYCYTVGIEVYEHGTNKVLSYASTKIANKYE